MYVVIFLLVSFLTTLLHELGHLIAAMTAKIKIISFSLGSTKPLLRKMNSRIYFKISGIRFFINPIASTAGIVRMKNININTPKYVAAAGPFSNLFLFVISYIYLYNNGINHIDIIKVINDSYIVTFFIFMLYLNLFTFIINISPFSKETDGAFIFGTYEDKDRKEKLLEHYSKIINRK